MRRERGHSVAWGISCADRQQARQLARGKWPTLALDQRGTVSQRHCRGVGMTAPARAAQVMG